MGHDDAPRGLGSRSGSGQAGVRDIDLQALVPPIVSISHAGHDADSGPVHLPLDGTMLSADISGFTRLSEKLAEEGRRGAELITAIINSCMQDLIEAAETYGGDVVKFGGDAVLLAFVGLGHARRAALAGAAMQTALLTNRHAQARSLAMTVGVASGRLDIILAGEVQRDLFVSGPVATHTLQLEAAAEPGEVVVSSAVLGAISGGQIRADGAAIFDTALRCKPSAHAAVPGSTLARYVPEALLSRYAEYAGLGAEHRRAAVAFVLVKGVDAHLAEHGGPATAAEFGRLLDGVATTLDQVGATLLHSDAAMDGFKLIIGAGVPFSTGTPADSILRAARSIVELESSLSIRVGVHIGPVFAGFVGPSHRRTFTVMGDAVNTAARLLGLCDDRDAVATIEVVDRARTDVVGERLDPVTVKGKLEPVLAMKIHGLGDAKRDDADRINFTGRDGERRAIVSALSRSQNIEIVGAAGLGKSRILHESVDPAETMVGSCGPYTTASPYAPFWRALREAFGIDVSLDPASAGLQVQAIVDRVHPAASTMTSLVAPAFGAELPTHPDADDIDPAFRQDVVHRMVADLLARRTPPVRVIVVDDTQWLDEASLALLGHLRLLASIRGWTVVQSRRPIGVRRAESGGEAESDGASEAEGEGPEGDAGSGGDEATGRLETLNLARLPDAAIERIIAEARPRRLTPAELAELVARADGNPLYAIELARATGAPGESLPATLEELVIARIDRLGPRRSLAVRLASILGAQFNAVLFDAFVTSSGHDAERDLTLLSDIFTIAPDGTVRFQQLLHREAVYSSIPFAQRARLHRQAGELVESQSRNLGAVAGLLSQHFAFGRDRARCWQYSMLAAETATRTYSPGDAARLYRRALDHAPRGLDEAERGRALEGLARALMSVGGLDEAYRLFGRARRHSATPAADLRLRSAQGMCRDRQGRFADALRVFAQVLVDAGDDQAEARAEAFLGRASVLHRLGRNRESFDEAGDALAIAGAAGLVALTGRARMLMHVAGEPVGEPGCTEAAEAALADFRATGQLSLEAEVLSNLGVSAQLAGDLDVASEHYHAALQRKQQVGDLIGAAMIEMNLGEVDLDRGVPDGVAALLEHCLATFELTGFQVGTAYTTGLLGRHALAVGDHDLAIERLTGAARTFDDLGAEAYAADMELVLIEALLAGGRRERADVLLVRNRERLRRGGVFDHPEAARARLDQLAQHRPA